jgi:RNA polymerase sigma-70 factor (ECF subfamily)
MMAALMTIPALAQVLPATPVDTGAELVGMRAVVRAVVARTLGSPLSHPDVEDGTHETFRRAIEGRERLRVGEPLRPWVIGIARHVALDVVRQRRRQRERTADLPPTSESTPDLTDRLPDSKPSPFERVAEAESATAVRSALARLPDGARRALELFHLEGKTYPEIATILDVPLGTVATWISRGRKAIAETLVQRSTP